VVVESLQSAGGIFVVGQVVLTQAPPPLAEAPYLARHNANPRGGPQDINSDSEAPHL
jgi:hypothetical protein